MKGYTTSEIADMLGVEAVTVRKYALALEKAGYIVERDAGDRRTYNERDAMAFQQLKALRERSGMSVEMAASVISSRHKEASESVTLAVSDEKSQEIERYVQRYAEFTETKMFELAQRFQQEIASSVAEVIRAERSSRLDDHFTQRRIEKQLRDEAEKLWMAKPESERLQGIFRKRENTEARLRFIQEYIEDHYEKRLREAYDN